MCILHIWLQQIYRRSECLFVFFGKRSRRKVCRHVVAFPPPTGRPNYELERAVCAIVHRPRKSKRKKEMNLCITSQNLLATRRAKIRCGDLLLDLDVFVRNRLTRTSCILLPLCFFSYIAFAIGLLRLCRGKGVVNVARACLEMKVPRLVVVSSGGVASPNSSVYKFLNLFGEVRIQFNTSTHRHLFPNVIW